MNSVEPAVTGRRTRSAALAIVVVLAIATISTISFARQKLPDAPALFLVFLTLAASADALTALLVLIQARIGRSMALVFLASGYLYSALVICVHALVFPGVFAPAGLLGADAQSAVWMWVFWHGGFPLFIGAYAVARHRNATARDMRQYRLYAQIALGGVFALVWAIAILVLRADRLLPRLIAKGHYGLLISSGVGPAVILAIVAGLAFLVYATRLRRTTDVWLAVALFAALMDCVLTLYASQRYTFGWYVARGESLISSTIVLVTFTFMVDRILRHLSALSHRDGLTGLANRRAFDEDLDGSLALGARFDRPVSLLMIDVDNFKAYNDAYGHPGGDEALRIVADCIAQSVERRTDVSARYGGEEFAVILPSTDEIGALRVADRIRAKVRSCGVVHRASSHGFVTVSIGASTMHGASAREKNADARLIAAADEALYRAKESGRNCAMLSTDSPLRANLGGAGVQPTIDLR
jgi:diguanylate cyclase (GGDEF)-like protein